MARSGIQYSDVQQAIDHLLARGDSPSVQRIREVLGTGSFTTISEHFRHWRTERAQNRDVPPPKDIPEAIVSLATEMWQQAQDVANEGLTHYREEADRSVDDARAQAEEAEQRAANAEQRESAIAKHLRHTETRLETLSGELAESAAQCKHWKEEAERHAVQQKAAQTQRSALEQQLKEQQRESQAALEHQRHAWEEKLTQEQQRNEATEGKLMALLDSVRQERAEEEKALNKRIQQHEKRLGTLNDSLKAEQQAHQYAQARQEAAEQALTQAQQATRQFEQQADQEAERLRRKLENALHTLEVTKHEHEVEARRQSEQWQNALSQRMEALQRQISGLPDSLRAQAERQGQNNTSHDAPNDAKNENAPR